MRNNILQKLTLFSFIIITLILWSCASQKKKAWNYAQTNPTEFAEWCKERFPIVTTKYVAGKKEIIKDSILVPGETIECPKPTIENPKPKIKTQDKYLPTEKEIWTPDTVFQTDTREIQIYSNQISELKKLNLECENDSKKISKDNISLQSELSKKKSTQYYGWVAFGTLITILVLYKVFKR